MSTLAIRSSRTAITARDSGIDLVRAASVLTVVAVHVLLCCVAVAHDDVTISTAVEDEGWFMIASWGLQVLPIMFIVGGFAAARHWRARRAKGDDARAFATARAVRLLAPALPMIAVVAVALLVAGLAGMPAALVEAGGYWIGRPLWFLAVYLGASALVPVMLRMHEAAPVRTLATLVGGALAVDGLRALTGEPVVGAANLALVWLALQQLGFWLADGSIDRVSRRAATLVLAAVASAFVAITAAGGSTEMLLDHNNPPTSLLVVLGVGQLAALRLGRARLDRVVRDARVAAAVAWVSPRSMHVYLWHMPALSLVVAAGLVAGLPMPEAGSPLWWLSRPVMLVATLAVVLVGLAVRPPRPILVDARPSLAAIVAGVTFATAVPIVLLVAGFSLVPAVTALVLGVVALRLLGAPAPWRRPDLRWSDLRRPDLRRPGLRWPDLRWAPSRIRQNRAHAG